MSIRTFLLSAVLLLGTLPTSAQPTFYSYSISTLMVHDTTEVLAIKFRIPVTRMDDFWDIWEDEMDDVAKGDFDEDDYRTFGTEVELEEDAEQLYSVHTRIQDIHDSIQIKVAFERDSVFISRENTPDLTIFEAKAKLWVTRSFSEYMNEILEEKEDLVDDAEDEVDDISDDLHGMKESIQDKQQKIQELQSDISEARQILANTAELIGQYRRQLGGLSPQLEDEREELEEQIEKQEKRQDNLQDDVRDWGNDIIELEEEIGELRIDIAAKETELRLANDDLGRARQVYAELRTRILSYRID